MPLGPINHDSWGSSVRPVGIGLLVSPHLLRRLRHAISTVHVNPVSALHRQMYGICKALRSTPGMRDTINIGWLNKYDSSLKDEVYSFQ